MVPTCSHVYPTGKTCGRIPRRGETLCRDHRRVAPAESGGDRIAFEEEMYRESDRVALLSFEEALCAAQEHLVALHSFMERRSTPRLHAHYTKACIGLTQLEDRLLAQPHALARTIPGLSPEHVSAIISILWHCQPLPPDSWPSEAD
jgi:hypothetical protein